MSLEYGHQNFNTSLVVGTVVVQMPTKEELENIFLCHANMTMFLAGLSVKSKNDRFIKKEGRKIAESRLSPIFFELTEVVQNGTKHIYNFKTDKILINKKRYYVRISLTTVAESKKVRLISTYIDTPGGDIYD